LAQDFICVGYCWESLWFWANCGQSRWFTFHTYRRLRIFPKTTCLDLDSRCLSFRHTLGLDGYTCVYIGCLGLSNILVFRSRMITFTVEFWSLSIVFYSMYWWLRILSWLLMLVVIKLWSFWS
jgi:hypothetical protein